MLLEPDLMVAAAFDLTPALLKQQAVKAVMVDLDDTLVASGDDYLEVAYREWFLSLKAAQIPVLILSNGTRKRVAHWSQELAVSGFAFSGKPFWGFRKGLKQLGSKAEQTVMVGDQLFTDILGAKLAGMKTVLVTPLSKGVLPHTRFLRKVERFMLKGSK